MSHSFPAILVRQHGPGSKIGILLSLKEENGTNPGQGRGTMNTLDSIGTMLNTLMGRLQGWAEELIRMIPNIVVALLILLAVWFVAGSLSRFVGRQLERVTDNDHVRLLVAKILRLGLILAGAVAALGVLHLQKTVASLLAGVGIIGLALGFAFQDIAANFMAGIFLAMRQPFRVGDLVKSGDFFGRIKAVNLRDTVGTTLQGQQVTIPNSQVFGKPLVNYSMADARRVDLACGVAYGDDLERAERLAIQAVEKVPQRVPEREVELFFEEFGDSSINFKVRFWVGAEQREFLAARSHAIKAIKQAFDAEGVTIPFPIRTLDFGVVGGEPLARHLKELDSGQRRESGSEAP